MKNMDEKAKEMVDFFMENKEQLRSKFWTNSNVYEFNGVTCFDYIEKNEKILAESDCTIATVFDDGRTTLTHNDADDIYIMDRVYNSFKIEKEVFLSEKEESTIDYLSKKIESTTPTSRSTFKRK